MTLTLLAIQFNHRSNNGATSALNIRKNATEMVRVPEWQRGLGVNPTDSTAAYAINQTRGRKLTIQGKFALSGSASRKLRIRALPVRRDQIPEGLLEWILSPWLPWPSYYNYYLWRLRQFWQSRTSMDGILGEVKATEVSFLPNGETNFETLELQNIRLGTRGVGAHTQTWRWQFQQGLGGPWTDFAQSAHTIYAVLETPKAPWSQGPLLTTNSQLPWTDVMDYACRWARGAKDRDEAATRITKAVYDLGPSVLEYDCPNQGSPFYTGIAPGEGFACSAFLQRLRGNPRFPRYVNCMDCAAIVSTFANILGCDLSQAGMYSSVGIPFTLNSILAIGDRVWRTACDFGAFNYHEVAWKDPCTANQELFDACLQVDKDSDPTGPPHTPFLPTNVRFEEYHNRLAAPAGRPNCEPQPMTTRQRRWVF